MVRIIVKREATSIKIRPEVWKETKIEAIRRGKTTSELVEEALLTFIRGVEKNLA